MANSLGDMIVSIGIDSSRLRQGLDNIRSTLSDANKSLGKIGASMKNAGKTMTQSLTLPIAGLGAVSVKLASDFEAGMSEVQAISGATGNQLEQLKDKAKEMGSTTKFSATQSAEALKYMALAGWDTEKMLGGIEGVMNLASASGEDLALVSDIVTDSMTAFGIEANKAGKFADILAATSSNANTNIAMLGESFKYVAPVAGAMGFTVEDTSLALGLMANAGIKASQSGTNLRAIFTRLVKPTKESQEAIDQLGLKVQNADGTLRPLRDILKDLRVKFADLTDVEKTNTAGKLAGQIAMSGLLSLVNAGEGDFNKLSKAIDGSEGRAVEMAKTMQNNLQGQLTQLKSALEGVAIQFGEILIPILKDLVQKYIMPLVQAFSKLSPETKKFIVIGAGLVAILGPIIAGIGMVASGVSALAPLLGAISLPMLGWVAGLVAVGVALVHLWRNNEEFRNKVKKIWEGIKTFFTNVFVEIKTYALKIWEDLKAYWNKNGDEISTNLMATWNSIYDFFKTTFDAIVLIGKLFWEAFKFIWDNFGENIVDGVKYYFNQISSTIKAVLDIITGILDVFIGLFTGDWKRMWEGAKKILEGVVGAIKTVINGLIGKIEGAINIFKKAKGLFSSADDEGKKAIQKAKKITPEQEKKVVTKTKARIGGSLDPMSSLNSRLQPQKIKFGAFANGGIIDRPTLALMGEGSESEAVIPLSKLKNMGGKQINITITGNNINDSMDLEIIADKLAKELTIAGVS